MTTNTLLATDSTAYLRRLVRELNEEGKLNGFYASVAYHNVRCNRARLRNGKLECHSHACSPEWFSPSDATFSDAYGRNIVASRRA